MSDPCEHTFEGSRPSAARTDGSSPLPIRVTLGTGSEVHYQDDASESRVLVDVGECSDENSSQCNRRVYVGDAYERQKATDETGAYTRDLYKVFAGGRQVAQVQRETRAGVTTETRRYVHADHLGSSQLITDEQGNVASLRRFNAFGELTSASSPDAASASIRSGFTGHETDVETGLVNMRGRIYDPKLGRFLQADVPFSSSPLSSQGLNRYSYALNNPLRFTDPSGFDPDAGDGEETPPPPPPEVPPEDVPTDGGGGDNTPVGTDQPPQWAATIEDDEGDSYCIGSACSSEEMSSSADPATGETEAMHESSGSAANGTAGTPGIDAPNLAALGADSGRTGFYVTVGAAQGALPFGTFITDVSPPHDARDRFGLGAGQLLGSATALTEAGTLAAGGVAEALTVVGVVPAIATEVAAVAVAVGAITNAATGILQYGYGG